MYSSGFLIGLTGSLFLAYCLIGGIVIIQKLVSNKFENARLLKDMKEQEKEAAAEILRAEADDLWDITDDELEEALKKATLKE
jgi:hypothetical protein